MQLINLKISDKNGRLTVDFFLACDCNLCSQWEECEKIEKLLNAYVHTNCSNFMKDPNKLKDVIGGHGKTSEDKSDSS